MGIKERPILFSSSMVRALQSGVKTQTRRVVKPQPKIPDGSYLKIGRHDGQVWGREPEEDTDAPLQPLMFLDKPMECPYGKVGDRLWVRETWNKCSESKFNKNDFSEVTLKYRAGGISDLIRRPPDEVLPGDSKASTGWVPSIHMPRWASRINLEITGVRVERFQDVTEEDAKSEGAKVWAKEKLTEGERWENQRMNFAMLWESINGDGSWEQNPWVWVIEFKRA